jgi:6-phosphofructo-2-kinase
MTWHVLGAANFILKKPYGVEFKAYRYNSVTRWFDYLPDFELRRQSGHH